jgi:hypothetical protein
MAYRLLVCPPSLWPLHQYWCVMLISVDSCSCLSLRQPRGDILSCRTEGDLLALKNFPGHFPRTPLSYFAPITYSHTASTSCKLIPTPCGWFLPEAGGGGRDQREKSDVVLGKKIGCGPGGFMPPPPIWDISISIRTRMLQNAWRWL